MRNGVTHVPGAETPRPGTEPPTYWGSDAVAAILRALDVPLPRARPGRELPRPARQPRQLSRQPAAADAALPARGARGGDRARLRQGDRAGRWRSVLHSNVGLMHATMAIFNAWCDRVPMLMLGATGPVDAAKRRPWIDWIHTAARPGCAGPPLHQVGRPARFDGRGAGVDPARRTRSPTPRRAGRSTSVSTPASRRRSSMRRRPCPTIAFRATAAGAAVPRDARPRGATARGSDASARSSPVAWAAAREHGANASRSRRSSAHAC